MVLLIWLGSVAMQEGGTVEEGLRFATFVLTRVAEAIGALVIAAAVVRAPIAWLAQNLPGRDRDASIESIRLGLGRSLGLALEFLLAADILATASRLRGRRSASSPPSRPFGHC